MPISLHPDGPNGPEIIVHMGYDDIGIGRITSDNPKVRGVGFKQLLEPRKDIGPLPTEVANEKSLTVFLSFTQEKAVILVENALRIIRQEMGMPALARPMEEVFTDSLYVQIGDLKNETEELKSQLASSVGRVEELEDENTALKLSLSSGGGKQSSAGYVLNAMKDRIAELKAKALELEGARACSCDPSPEEKEIMRIIDEKY